MMKTMKLDVIKKGTYGYDISGSRAVELIMDNDTPGLDLLVREAIQNSADATMPSSAFDNCLITFNLVDFLPKTLASSLDVVGERLLDVYGSVCSKALIISDKHTIGLRGEPDGTGSNGTNLYKLVYSLMDSGKDDSDSGGSWGIGKTVYFKFGKGLVFYYSRVLENGIYKEKLAGAIIEEETSSKAICRSVPKSIGIAFLGEDGYDSENRKRSVPIIDHDQIEKFLSIFDTSCYTGNSTGTRIIIPYFDDVDILKQRNRADTNVQWEDDFEDSLIEAIQRWYFPRLNNLDYYERTGAKYLSVFVNGKQVELNPFYKKMQDLYMGRVEDAENLIISSNTFNAPLGTFYYKKFTKLELDVETPPNNYPSPYLMLDIDEDNDPNTNEAVIFYVRKPGMIISYQETKEFFKLKTNKDEYLIGVFVLNDKASYHNETVGNYFRACEHSNHKKWEDLKISKPKYKIIEIPKLKSKPYKIIRNHIYTELNSKFGQTITYEYVSKNSKLQKKLGDILLPPEDFGKEPTISRPKKGEGRKKLDTLKKESRTNVINNGFVDGNPSYSFQIYLKPGEQYIAKLDVQTSSKKYTFDDWDKYNFVLPCYFKKLIIDEFQIDKVTYHQIIRRDFENNERNIIKSNGLGVKQFQILVFETPITNKVCGFKLTNNSSDEDLRITINVILQSVDETTGFSISRSLTRMGGDNNG